MSYKFLGRSVWGWVSMAIFAGAMCLGVLRVISLPWTALLSTAGLVGAAVATVKYKGD